MGPAPATIHNAIAVHRRSWIRSLSKPAARVLDARPGCGSWRCAAGHPWRRRPRTPLRPGSGACDAARPSPQIRPPLARPDPRPDRRPRCPAHPAKPPSADCDRAKQEHPYEVPSVVAVPIIDGGPDYIGWISEQIEQPALNRADKAASWWEPRSPTASRVEGASRTVLACPTPAAGAHQPAWHPSRASPATSPTTPRPGHTLVVIVVSGSPMWRCIRYAAARR